MVGAGATRRGALERQGRELKDTRYDELHSYVSTRILLITPQDKINSEFNSKLAPKLKLVYFNIRGRGELIRLTLHVGGIAFADERVEFADWPSRKEHAPDGRLPYIEINGKIFGETLPITRFVAAKCTVQYPAIRRIGLTLSVMHVVKGLAGRTEEEKLYVDIILKQNETFRDDITRVKMDSLLNNGQRKYLDDKLRSQRIPTFLNRCEESLSIGKTGYCLGQGLTIADLAVWDTVDVLLTDYPNLLENYPKVQAHRERIQNLPKLKKYLSSRPVTTL